MLVLLPPSEGKSDAAGTGSFKKVEPDLVTDAAAVFRHVDRLKRTEQSKFYGIKDPAKAKAVHELNQSALTGGCVKALERYTGVVYQHLGFSTLTRRNDAERRLLVVSGYFGLVRGSTMLPNYKMPINGWLAKFWSPINAARLRTVAGRKPVLSLLPRAYAKALPCENLIPVDFRVEGGKKPAGHFGKAIKGTFVRWLIENRVGSTKDFGDFSEAGFTFDDTNFIRR